MFMKWHIVRDGKDSRHDSRGHWGQGNAGLSVPVKHWLPEAREEPEQRQDDNLDINISLIKFKSLTEVSIFNISQPGTSSVSSHPVDPNELLCSQLGLSQSNQSWTDENWPRLGPTPIIIRVQISKYHLKQVGFLHYLKHCCHRCLIEFSGKKDPNIDNNRRVKMRQRYLYLQITKLSLSLTNFTMFILLSDYTANLYFRQRNQSSSQK